MPYLRDMNPVEMSDLRGQGREELERLFCEAPWGPIPSGRFRGSFLAWCDAPGAISPPLRVVDWLAFRVAPFGVDFARQAWFFWFPSARVGRFTLRRTRSRWRDTEVLALDYEVSRLPGFLRRQLYDEVKPLSDRIVLGLGGVNAPAGQGEHFFFALERMAEEDPRSSAGRHNGCS
jgi:hypothetical protein